MEKRHYETILILMPDLPQSVTQDIVKKYVSLLEEQEAQITYQGEAKLRKLAYPIQKQRNGIQQVIRFIGSPLVVNKLEVLYKIDEGILRFLTIRLNKDALLYYQKKETTEIDKNE